MIRGTKLFASAAATVLLGLASLPANAVLLYATSGADLAQFDSASPGVVSSVPVTGLQGGETLVGIDVRSFDQRVYGVGSTNRLYTINPTTGVATQVGAAGGFTLSGTSFAFDFNPVPDRLRVISNTGQNIRINPNDGTLASTDTNINPGGVTVTGGAYSNNGNGGAGGLTTLYAIDVTNGVLTTVGSVNGSPNSPNGGTVGPTVGSLGLGTGLDNRVGFDITGTTNNSVFASILTTTPTTADRLYSINLTTGAATLVGTIGTGSIIYGGLTAATAVPEPASLGVLAIGAIGLLARRRRTAN